MRVLLLIIALFATPAFAQNPAGAVDAVEYMKVFYTHYFRGLPEMRKCTPGDTKGMWKESAIRESLRTEVKAQATEGKKYLNFDEYNRLLMMRSQFDLKSDAITTATATTPLQFITTVAGMLYVYQNNAVESSWLCYVTTGTNDEFKNAGLLVLAVPTGKDTPLIMSFFAPLEN